MQTAQEFFDDYLREKAALAKTYHEMWVQGHSKFFTEDYINHARNWQANLEAAPTVLQRAEIVGSTAKMYTSEPLGTRQQHYRYILSVSEDRWQIESLQWECFRCKGTGQRQEKPCPSCNGEGFKDSRSSDNE
jgi:hypothetical protein